MDVVDEAAHLPLPLLRRQARVHRQVLHHIEVIAHLISQTCSQSRVGGESQSVGLQSPQRGWSEVNGKRGALCTCEVAELGYEHGWAGQRASRASSPLGLAHQHWLLQVRDFLVVLLLRKRGSYARPQPGRVPYWQFTTEAEDQAGRDTLSKHPEGDMRTPAAAASAEGLGAEGWV